ncbi:hypothetical protein PHYBLDRAFT_96684, partial [Phycomyces blakesleeanus NRRL 1555(-)]
GRLDKYYHLAKEQGYRARSAFKLIQLNKKYSFLEKSRVLIDLCAAPGGWYVLNKKSRNCNQCLIIMLILGVDLAPIKPIPGVITFQDDITTERCRQNLRQEMKTWKADVVLHDGAPNVGAAWSHDAFSQSELVLVSLKLATEFLAKGGTFVTKVFRSKDYNKLLWVFQQLFRKVEATKPPSSRNVSAEIFVVCRDFLAPKKIDPRFLDPKAVFSEIDTDEAAKMTDIFKPEKKRRHRDGYEDGNYTQHKNVDVMEFITAKDAIAVLGSYNELVFESDESKELLKKSATTEDVKINCKDLKVLGKRDFKTLLQWRTAIRAEYKLDKKEERIESIVVEEEPLDEDEQIQAELDNLTKEEAAKRKREKRKSNEKKTKLIQRMQLNMTAPTDIGLEQQGPEDEQMFNISKITKEELEGADASLSKKMKGRIAEMDADMDMMSDEGSDYELELEKQMDADYDRYIARKVEKDAKFRAKQAREEEDEWKGFDGKRTPKRKKADLAKRTASGLTKGASMFFDQDIFKGVDLEGDDEEEDEQLEAMEIDMKSRKRKAEEELMEESEEDARDDADSESDFEIAPTEDNVPSDEEIWDGNEDENSKAMRAAQENGLITAEAITLARQLANKEKTAADLIDQGFTKEAFRDKDGAPVWFLDDEKKHNRPHLPVTKEAVSALKEKLKALDARPIKKIAEAKARKKFKTMKRIQKAQKKANDVADNPDMSEKEKLTSINKLLSRSTKSKPKKEVKLVVAKGSNRGLKGRPTGVKGRYKMVDARMKKEMRAMKRKAKSQK